MFGAPPPIGGRGPAPHALGYTGATANHLWTYGEFMAMYLLAWSPVLWPATLLEFPTNPPLVPDVDPDVSEKSWNDDRDNVGLFKSALAAGAPGAGERAVADDLRRPRDHRRLEHRPAVGQHGLCRRTRRPAGGRPTACSPTSSASTGGTSRPRSRRPARRSSGCSRPSRAPSRRRRRAARRRRAHRFSAFRRTSCRRRRRRRCCAT